MIILLSLIAFAANMSTIKLFILPPWKQIYTEDNERYESYEQAVEIHDELARSYAFHGYEAVEVPQGTIAERTTFILEHLG